MSNYISQGLLPEFDQEAANTRKTLERLPDDRFDWKPHAKSFALGPLAIHVANIPSWAAMMASTDHLDINPPGGPSWTPPQAKNREEVMAMFEENVAKGREALAGMSDSEFMSNWSLLNHGETVFTMPKVAVIRSMVMNHIVHHRAQLTVYYRLNDIPVPSLYGPSADEQMS